MYNVIKVINVLDYKAANVTIDVFKKIIKAIKPCLQAKFQSFNMSFSDGNLIDWSFRERSARSGCVH